MVELVQVPVEPEDWRIEAIARALCAQKGCDPDTLHQHFPHEDWPEDSLFMNSRGERCPMHRAWRKDEKSARAAYLAVVSGRLLKDAE